MREKMRGGGVSGEAREREREKGEGGREGD